MTGDKQARCFKISVLVAVVVTNVFIAINLFMPEKDVQVPRIHLYPVHCLNNSFNISYVEENLEKLDQKDPRLIQYTRIRHLTPPPFSGRPVSSPSKMQPDAFGGWVANFFKNKTGGIFIEAGANDGIGGTHTLYLERVLGWTGLLVECNPLVVPLLRSKRRKAWIADVCLSPTGHAGTGNLSNPVGWSASSNLGGPWKLPAFTKSTKWTFLDVPLIPLYTLVAALGWNEIDYFSFDIEGQEMAVLKTFPFHLVIFKVLIVEVSGFYVTPMQMEEMDALLTSKGYIFIKNMDMDRLYVHKKYA